jgi:hypothetical protein
MSSTQQRFCEQCGTAMSPTARFCGKCGQPVSDSAAGPTLAPAPKAPAPTEQVRVAIAEDQAYAVAQAAPKKKSSVWSRLLFVLIGLALIFLGLRGPILGLVGEQATATVTDVSEGEDHQYDVAYRFTVNGSEVRGAWTQEALNIATLPREGNTVSVRYLPAWPGMMNVPANQAAPSIANLALAALGLALILFNGKFRIGATGSRR